MSLLVSAEAQLVSSGPLPLLSPLLQEHLYWLWHLPPFLRTQSQLSVSENE